MYNESSGFSIRSFMIKAILVVLFVFLLMWLIPFPNMKPVYDGIFADNLNTMKMAAKNYYTVDRMPKNNDETVKITLKEMLTNKLLLPINDSEGKECDENTSYVEVMKTEKEYVIKTSLTCGKKTDYVVEHIGCYDTCEDCKIVDETPTKPANPQTPAKPSKPTVTPTKPTQPTVTPTKPETPVKPIKTQVTEIKYWKESHYEDTGYVYSPLSTTITEKDGIIKTTTLLHAYSTSINRIERKSLNIYSSGGLSGGKYYSSPITYTPVDSTGAPNPRLLNLDGMGVSKSAQNNGPDWINMKVDNYGGFNNNYYKNDYQNYINTCGKYMYLAYNWGGCNNNLKAYDMQKNALTYGTDFTVSKPTLIWDNSRKTYIVDTWAYSNNNFGYLQYKTGDYNFSHWFTVSWNDYATYPVTVYNYRIETSYKEEWVAAGSTREKELINRGYKEINRKTYYK